jgi:hypothetical protein
MKIVAGAGALVGGLVAVTCAVATASGASAASTSTYDNIMVKADHAGSVLVYNTGMESNCVPLVPGTWASAGIPAGVGEGVAFTVTSDNTTCSGGTKYVYTAPSNPGSRTNWWVTVP